MSLSVALLCNRFKLCLFQPIPVALFKRDKDRVRWTDVLAAPADAADAQLLAPLLARDALGAFAARVAVIAEFADHVAVGGRAAKAP